MLIMLIQTYSKKHNDSIYTQNHNSFFFLSEYIRMKNQTQKGIVLKCNVKKVLTSLLPMVKKMMNNKINQIKLGIMKKIIPKN